jgi:ethanolamine ammonia-lyase large subunit
VTIKEVRSEESVFEYVERVKGRFNLTLYQQVVGAANSYKEGDEALGLAADNDITRLHARMLLLNTKVEDFHDHPLYEDDLQELIWETTDKGEYGHVRGWSLGELKHFLLTSPEGEIKEIMGGLNSDVIACLAKIMTNAELSSVARKISNPLPGRNLGEKGYVGAAIQAGSSYNDPEDIIWQVFDAWSYATGDLVISAYPAGGDLETVHKIQQALKDVVVTFGLESIMPWCVMTRIDTQAACEDVYPGSTSLWFQKLGGCDEGNAALGVSFRDMIRYAGMRDGPFGLYHETGQGADLLRGAGNGFDMVVHESRKYGFSRALKMEIAEVSRHNPVWSHTNDAGGSIGPQVLHTPGQLVRCCLEDIFMGKLHGLTMGVDITSTLHMLLDPADLEWCIDQIMPANPAYLKALPTRIDPVLNRLTTSFQDHVRLRRKFGYKADGALWDFFKRIGIVDPEESYTEHFGDPLWVYYQYRSAKGDERTRAEIYAEGETALERVEARGILIARGHGKNVWDFHPSLENKMNSFFDEVKASLWAEFTPEFLKTLPHAMMISTASEDRKDFFVRPATSTRLNQPGISALERLRKGWAGQGPDVQIIISDGLNAKIVMDDSCHKPYIQTLRKELQKTGLRTSKEIVVIKNGEVEAAYAAAQVLFRKSDPSDLKVMVHLMGETPVGGDQSFSVHVAGADGKAWAEGARDGYTIEVIGGISGTALKPRDAAVLTADLVVGMSR